MNPKIDSYLIDGCGRCSLYKTPDCKVISWQSELKQLRKIVLSSGLREELKWSQPCYTLNGKNVLLVAAFKGYAFISFFKGALLKDKSKILDSPGKSSQAFRQIRFTSVQQIDKMKSLIDTYIFEAIEIEEKGMKVQLQKNMEPAPDELHEQFIADPDFEKPLKL